MLAQLRARQLPDDLASRRRGRGILEEAAIIREKPRRRYDAYHYGSLHLSLIFLSHDRGAVHNSDPISETQSFICNKKARGL
jgi:hypothetical protein